MTAPETSFHEIPAGTWVVVIFANGEIMIEAPPGESEEDF